MILSTYISAVLEDGKRLLTTLVYGKNGTLESSEIMPSGIDSAPIKNMKAIYSDTLNNRTRCIIGYINTSQLSEAGEFRAYSTKEEGSVCTYLWLHAVEGEGQIEIGGTTDNAVGYNQLQTQFNELNQKFNSLVSAFNSHIHTGVTTGVGVSGTPSPVPTLIPATPSTADITLAKNTKIKTL